MSTSPAGFTPTHVVPSGGLQAWATPDPAQPVIATIEARVEVVVREERGAWAEVLCSNGWSAWVDGRRLVAVGAAAPAGPAPAASAARPAAQVDGGTFTRLATPPVVGAMVLALSSLLPWTRGDFLSETAFEVPLSFLWSKTASSGVKLGVLVLLLGIAGAVIASLPGVQRFRVAVGGLAAACIVVYVIQLQRLVSGTSFDVTDVLGVGAGVGLIGAVALAVAPPAWSKRT